MASLSSFDTDDDEQREGVELIAVECHLITNFQVMFLSAANYL